MTTSDFLNEKSVSPAILPDPETGLTDAWRHKESYAFQAALLGALLERRLSAMLAPIGLTTAEFRILVALDTLGPSTAAALAKLTPIDPSFISRTVQRLAERGLLARRRSRNDRRTILLRPTPEAMDLLERCKQPLRELDAQVLAGVGAQELRCGKELLARTLANSLGANAA